MQWSIREITMRNNDLWCTTCSTKGNTEYNCRLQDDRRPTDCWVVHTSYYCDICEVFEPHSTTDCPCKAKNAKPKWCGIFQMIQNSIVECIKNLNTKANYNTVYQTQTIKQIGWKGHNKNKCNNGYNRRGGYNGHGWYNGWGGYHQPGCANPCWYVCYSE